MIISSDLSHYLPGRTAVPRDQATLGHILSGLQPEGDNCLCGPESLSCFLAVAHRRSWIAHFLAHSHSGSTGGDGNCVVGYGALAWTTRPTVFSKESLSALEKLALDSIGCALVGKALPEIPPLERKFPQLRSLRSVFVTLQKGGELRGCIGSLGQFSHSVAHGVREYAVAAAFQDSRFPPVNAGELPQLTAHVSILSFPRPLLLPPEEWPKFLSEQTSKPGVILEIGGGRSVFLPEVWEQLPEAEMFLGALSRKQGRPEGAWKGKGARLLTYDTVHS